MLYEQDGITVDERFVRFGSKSYAINKINSVDVRMETIKGSAAWIIWWALALIVAMMALSSEEAPWGLWTVAAVLAFVGWNARSKRHPTSIYRLFLVTSSNEAQAFETVNEAQIVQLRAAIEDAMSRST